MTWPIAAGLVSLPLWLDAPLWGMLGTLGSVLWTFRVWLTEIESRTPLPEVAGDIFSPLDVSISWRTPAGDCPTFRRGWKAVLAENDLWLHPIKGLAWFGGDRDYVRISRLDIVGGMIASDTEIRIRFVDEGRSQEVRLSHVPRALELATSLGLSEDRESRIV